MGPPPCEFYIYFFLHVTASEVVLFCLYFCYFYYRICSRAELQSVCLCKYFHCPFGYTYLYKYICHFVAVFIAGDN